MFDVEQVIQPHLIPMEANLDGWPLFSRQKGRKKGATLRVAHKVATSGGNRVEQLWQASALPEFCLPGPFDEDVFVGVMALVKRRGGMPEDGRVRLPRQSVPSLLSSPVVLDPKKRIFMRTFKMLCEATRHV